MTSQALVVALPFLAYVAALYVSYRWGKFTMHRDVRARVLGCEHEIAVLADQVMRHQKRDAAEASIASRAAKAAAPATGPHALTDDRVPLEQRRDMLRKAFGEKERAG